MAEEVWQHADRHSAEGDWVPHLEYKTTRRRLSSAGSQEKGLFHIGWILSIRHQNLPTQWHTSSNKTSLIVSLPMSQPCSDHHMCPDSCFPVLSHSGLSPPGPSCSHLHPPTLLPMKVPFFCPPVMCILFPILRTTSKIFYYCWYFIVKYVRFI